VLFVLSWMLLRFLFQLGSQIMWRLGEIRERPGLPIAIGLFACGTLCALLVVWHIERRRAVTVLPRAAEYLFGH
jgi:hypothetical protein